MSGSNCDNSAQSDLDGPKWVRFEKALIDQRIKDGKPLTITFHGHMDTDGKAPAKQWFQAMNEILDYLKANGDQVKLMTYSQLVDLYFPPKK